MMIRGKNDFGHLPVEEIHGRRADMFAKFGFWNLLFARAAAQTA